MLNEKPEAILTKWRLTKFFGGEPCLHGVVTGHPTVADGQTVYTSTVRSIDFEKKVAVTQNTIYKLVEHVEGK